MRKRSIRTKIIGYVMAVSIVIVCLITSFMVAASFKMTDQTMLDTMQPMAKIASQNVSSNLHLLTERIYQLSQSVEIKTILQDSERDETDTETFLAERANEVEFVWIGIYHTDGSKYIGYGNAPEDITSQKYFQFLQQTGNIVIGEPAMLDNIVQLAVGMPLKTEEDTAYYLIGSYKYDILNDVLSNMNLGETGSAYIVNEDGVIVCDKDMENISKEVNVYDKYPESKEMFDKAINGQTGSQKISMHDMPHYASYSPVPGTLWSLVIDVPVEEFKKASVVMAALGVALAVGVLIIAGIVITLIVSKMTRSLRIATKRIEALSEGDLTSEVKETRTGDEIEVLTNALANTVKQLNDYISNIRFILGELSNGNYTVGTNGEYRGDFAALKDALEIITDSLNRNMGAMKSSAKEVSQNTNLISTHTQQMRQDSDRQIEAVTRLNESTNKIVSNITTIVDSAKQVKECSDETSFKVAQSSEEMAGLIANMDEINSNMNEIKRISSMIENIAMQTNLLSLNASIEASRAGEHGRGFAVVAGQVRELAVQSANASAQTADIIKNTSDTIRKGVEAAKILGVSLNEIAENTSHFTDITYNLEQVIVEQQSAADDVKSDLQSVDQIAGNNAETAEQTNAACEDFAKQARMLANLVAHVQIRNE
ncbi:methyl-accepting chemotaxis protein [bacterium C-53]|nr:methyl-accepting chemotaxis protein [Lachnospiraceae bacterium]NBI01738.1 methyl-accepting chemotaxis protein [Lachnospiraceae bacterium]RKJ12158.1 methyl-accepting chemotaxis protein [bacterium C-53]